MVQKLTDKLADHQVGWNLPTHHLQHIKESLRSFFTIAEKVLVFLWIKKQVFEIGACLGDLARDISRFRIP